ncbi:MAG TPA: carboxypeptidase regulatory-like domain-containing protein [Oscillatoriaceae cyanobacterium]
MPRPARFVAPALAFALALVQSAPARAEIPATTSMWGYSGLVLMPTADVYGFRDYSVGLGVLTKGQAFSLTPYATAGVFDGLEATVLYGVPVSGFSGLTGSFKYQLIRPTRERPTSVAVGLSMIGVSGTDQDRYVDGNNLYLVLSQDFNANIGGATYTLFRGHFGFEGNLSLGSRAMAGLEIPIYDKASLVGEFMGPMGSRSWFADFGASYRPTPEWQFRIYTMGNPNGSFTDRDYAAGVSYSGNFLGPIREVAEKPGPQPTSHPRPEPSPLPSLELRATPAPLPSIPVATPAPLPSAPIATPTPVGTPTPAPGTAELRGTVLDDRGRPLPGWSVGVPEANVWTTSDAGGHYTLHLPLGPYHLTVKDPDGTVRLTKAIRLVTPAGMELPLVVSLPDGDLKGMVVDRTSKQGVGSATIQLFRSGETYDLSSDDTGAFSMADLPEGTYKIVVTRPRYSPFEGTLQITARQETSLVVPLSAKPGSIAGRVTNLKGDGQPEVVIEVPSLHLTTTTDRLGAYRFAELPPGQYEVTYTQNGRRVSTTVVDVRSDETTTENVTTVNEVVAPNKAGTISGRVLDATTKRPVSDVKIVVEGGDLTVMTLTASDGYYTVSDLPPGRYKLTASKPGYKTRLSSASVTAKVGATVNIGLQLSH